MYTKSKTKIIFVKAGLAKKTGFLYGNLRISRLANFNYSYF